MWIVNQFAAMEVAHVVTAIFSLLNVFLIMHLLRNRQPMFRLVIVILWTANMVAAITGAHKIGVFVMGLAIALTWLALTRKPK
jgi:hypothetical protein